MEWMANSWPHVLGAGEFSWRVLLTLLVVLGLSATMFALLVQRWTTQRRRIVLSDWCKGKGFKVGNPETPPALLGELKAPARVREWVGNEDTVLMVVEVEKIASATQASQLQREPGKRFHVLVRVMEIEGEWKATGLRPAHVRQGESLLDLYSLSSYPALGNVERFVVYGTDTLSARVLSQSHGRGLLPADVGLLLVGKKLMLDFSARHFDPIEFDRMVALAEQLVGQLPSPR